MEKGKLEGKEKELNERFKIEKEEALAIEEQIKVLQAKYKEKMDSLIKLQGAFSLLQELKKEMEKGSE